MACGVVVCCVSTVDPAEEAEVAAAVIGDDEPPVTAAFVGVGAVVGIVVGGAVVGPRGYSQTKT